MIEWMIRYMSGWIEGWMDGWIDGWMDRWMDGWMDGRMDGWMDGRNDVLHGNKPENSAVLVFFLKTLIRVYNFVEQLLIFTQSGNSGHQPTIAQSALTLIRKLNA